MARAALQSRLQRVEGDEHRSHLRDGVDAEVGARTVRGDAARLDLERDEPAVRDRQLQLRRLHHDRRVRVDALEHGLRSDGAELLVGDEGENDVAANLTDRCRGERALHVIRAATIQASVLDTRIERPIHAAESDRVQVSVEQERAAAAGPSTYRDDARPLIPDDLGVQALVLAPVRDERSRLTIAPAAWNE